jgi:transcriptional regulator with XRE-family HTH domain
MLSSAGERLRIARRRKGWTQKELAERVNCSQQTIVDIEAQETPRSRFLTQIVVELGESLDWIESGVGGPCGSDDIASVHLPHLDLVNCALRALDPTLVDRVIDALFSTPIDMSRMSFTVSVDVNTVELMADHCRVDDVLWVDPCADLAPGRLVLAVMPGWDRAELMLYRSASGRRFLERDSADLGPKRMEVSPYRAVGEYMAHGESTAPEAASPALIIGVVVFIGQEH